MPLFDQDKLDKQSLTSRSALTFWSVLTLHLETYMMSTVLDAYLSLYNHASGHKDMKYQLLVWPSTKVLDKLLIHNVSSIYGKGKVVTFTLPEAYIQKEELHSFWYHYRFHAMPRCDNHHWWLYLFDSERAVVTQLNSLQQ